jgi:hypothetical protein
VTRHLDPKEQSLMLDRSPQSWLAGLILLLSACAGDAGPEWMGTVSDSVGVRIVQNPTEGLWTPESQWTVTEELRIGEVTGEPEYQFGNLIGIDLDDAGNIYAVDQQAQEVRVFDANGTYLRTLGGPGSGPGELGAAASGVWIGPDGRARVADLANGRLNFYLPDGTPDGSFNIPLAQGIPIRWKMSPEGLLLGQLRVLPQAGQDVPEGPPDGDAIVAYNDDGTIADTVHTLPPGLSIQATGGQPRVTIFSPEPVWDQTIDGTFVSAMNSAYRVEFWSADGQLTQVLNRDVTRKPVTETDEATMLRLLGNLFAEQGLPPATVQQVLQGFDFADTYPAFLNLLVADDGSTWLQQIQTADELAAGGDEFNPQDLGSSRWDVFDREGRYLGELTFPERLTPLKSTGDAVWGIARDELDVQYIVKLRVVRPAT